MKKIGLFVIILAAILTSCSSEPKYEVEVNIKNNSSLKDKEIIISQKVDGETTYSKVSTIKGDNFSLDIPAQKDALLFLVIPESDINEIMLAAGEGGSIIHVNIDGEKVNFSGTPLNDKLQSYIQATEAVSASFEKLDNDFSQLQEAGNLTTEAIENHKLERSQLLKENTDRIIAFIKENVDNPVGEYYFVNNYVMFPIDRKQEMQSFATDKIKKSIGIE